MSHTYENMSLDIEDYELYVDTLTVDDGKYYVFGYESGYMYASFDSEDEAKKYVAERNQKMKQKRADQE